MNQEELNSGVSGEADSSKSVETKKNPVFLEYLKKTRKFSEFLESSKISERFVNLRGDEVEEDYPLDYFITLNCQRAKNPIRDYFTGNKQAYTEQEKKYYEEFQYIDEINGVLTKCTQKIEEFETENGEMAYSNRIKELIANFQKALESRKLIDIFQSATELEVYCAGIKHAVKSE